MKFKWVDFQLKFKVPHSPLAHKGERGEFWTLVESQLIWTILNFMQLCFHMMLQAQGKNRIETFLDDASTFDCVRQEGLKIELVAIPNLFQVPTRTCFPMIGCQTIKSDFSAIPEVLTCLTTTSY